MPDSQPTPEPTPPPSPTFLQLRLSLWGSLSVIPALVCFGTLVANLGAYYWAFDVLSSFRTFYCWSLALAAIVFFVAKQRRAAGIFAVFSLLNATTFIPLYFGREPSPPDSPRIRILSANVLAGNTDYYRLFDLIEAEQPDLIFLYEFRSDWAEQCEQLKVTYPFHVLDPQPGSFGIGCFSKMSPEKLELLELGPAGFATIHARFRIDGQPLTIVGTHPIPPITRDFSSWRDAQMLEIADVLGKVEGPAALLGDFNMTADSSVYREVCRRADLRDSRKGFGIQSSWPADLSALFRIPIDHCLVSDDIQVLDRRLGPYIGSDHFPVIVDLVPR